VCYYYYMNPTTNTTVQVDVTDVDNLDLPDGVTSHIVTDHGPATGWPVVELTGPPALLKDWLLANGYDEFEDPLWSLS
jgi:hypothetical protein